MELVANFLWYTYNSLLPISRAKVALKINEVQNFTKKFSLDFLLYFFSENDGWLLTGLTWRSARLYDLCCYGFVSHQLNIQLKIPRNKKDIQKLRITNSKNDGCLLRTLTTLALRPGAVHFLFYFFNWYLSAVVFRVFQLLCRFLFLSICDA